MYNKLIFFYIYIKRLNEHMKYLKSKLYIHVVSKKEDGKAALNKQDSGFVQLNNIDLTSNLFLFF